MEATVVGRILKRHHFSKNMVFYDAVVAPAIIASTIDGEESNPNANNEQLYTFVSISVQRNDDEEVFPKAVVGDVIQVSGKVHNVAEFRARLQRLSLDVHVHDVQVLSSHQLTEKSTSFFTFDKMKMGKDFQTYDLVELPLPTMAIQVGLKQLERFVVAFRDVFGDLFEARESSTGYSNSSDRLLVFRAHSGLNDSDLREVYDSTIKSLVSDPTLGPAVLRSYPAKCGFDTHSFCSTQLSHVVTKLTTLAHEQAAVLRLQCYPKAVMTQVLTIDATQPSSRLPLHPTQNTHVAYVFLCDGAWVVSMVPRQHCFIGDLREKKPVDESMIAGGATAAGAAAGGAATAAAAATTTAGVTICRAGAKIEEIMRRKRWLHVQEDGTTSANHGNEKYRYRLAVDVGASPGGWSYYLATQANVERVIAIDKGELHLPEPWPAHLFYWSMLGDDAMKYLHHLSLVAAAAAGAAATGNDAAALVDETPSFPPRASLQQHDDAALFTSAFPLAADDHHGPYCQRQIDLYCCDANIPPTSTTAILLEAVQRHLIANNARIVLTFKNPFGKKDLWQTSVQTSWQQLQAAGFVEIEELHLLANTAKETTITAIYRP